MIIRKFYDAATGEAAAAATTATPRYELVNEPLSLDDVYKGFEVPEKTNVEEKKEETVDKKEEKTEVKETIVEKKEEAKSEVKQEAAAQVAVPDWKELISKVDPKEVHKFLNIDEDALKFSKELGQDEFVKKLLTYRKDNGNLTPFIEAATKDWDKVDHLDLLRDDLKRQHPGLSKEKFAILTKNRIDKRFILGEDADAAEAELAAVDLEVEAEKVRQARKTEQQTFLDSVKPVDKTQEIQLAQKEKEATAQKEYDEFKSMVEANADFVKLNAEKKITVGTKEQPFNYTVNPDSIKEQALDSNKFFDPFWTVEEGKRPIFNVALWSRVSAYAQNPTAYDEALINHGISIGQKKIIEGELENTSQKGDQQTQIKAKSLAKTFADEGQPITLGELYGT